MRNRQEANIASELNWSRDEQPTGSRLTDLAGSLLLHAAALGTLLAWNLIHPPGHTWGESATTAGAIQATMVAALPLPPRQRTIDTGVLTSDTPSPAPVVAKERTQPPPKPNEIVIPDRIPPKAPKVADRPAPEPPKHVQPAPPQPTKAATGETAGIRIPQASMQLKNGTASVSVQERSFGERFPYYVNAVTRKIIENWYSQEADPRASNGKQVAIGFEIARDGSVSNIHMTSRSGSPTLDTSALRALQRVESFGPLPQGDHITVEYSFDYHQP